MCKIHASSRLLYFQQVRFSRRWPVGKPIPIVGRKDNKTRSNRVQDVVGTLRQAKAQILCQYRLSNDRLIFHRFLLVIEKSANLHKFRLIAKIFTFDLIREATIYGHRKGRPRRPALSCLNRAITASCFTVFCEQREKTGLMRHCCGNSTHFLRVTSSQQTQTAFCRI